MLEVIFGWFIKDHKNLASDTVREAYGRFAGITGVLCNVFLFAIKLAIGIVFASISVIADAVNNLSDALSSVITAVCFKMSNKPADADHPYGHQRMEYVAAMLISFIIIFVGYELICTSFDRILNPSKTTFGILAVVTLVISVVIKLFMFRNYTVISKKIDSKVLKASAQDSINDVISTLAVLISFIISSLTSLQLDGFVGLGVSVFIIFSGISLVRETLTPLLGTVPDESFFDDIEKKILSYDGVIGMHDLMIHTYGPNRFYASVHVEVPASEDILTSHDIIDNIERDFAKENIHLVIHMDPIVTDDENVTGLKDSVAEIIAEISDKISFHDFRVVFGTIHTKLIFDVEIPYDFSFSEKELNSIIQNEVEKKIGKTHYCVISFDRKHTKA